MRSRWAAGPCWKTQMVFGQSEVTPVWKQATAWPRTCIAHTQTIDYASFLHQLMNTHSFTQTGVEVWYSVDTRRVDPCTFSSIWPCFSNACFVPLFQPQLIYFLASTLYLDHTFSLFFHLLSIFPHLLNFSLKRQTSSCPELLLGFSLSFSSSWPWRSLT